MKRTIIAAAAALLLALGASAQNTDNTPTRRTLPDGTVVINTTELGKDVLGFADVTPVEISIKDGKITAVKALPNQETPKFFVNAERLLSSWLGLTPKQALEKKVDAVSGATYSSDALIQNVRLGLEYATK